MANTQNLIPFEKGDSRINRRGRPKKSDLIASLSKTLLEEQVASASSGQTITRLEAILREWLSSGNLQKQLAVIRYAYGKGPENPAESDRDVSIVVNWGKTITTQVIENSEIYPTSLFETDAEDDIHPRIPDIQ